MNQVAKNILSLHDKTTTKITKNTEKFLIEWLSESIKNTPEMRKIWREILKNANHKTIDFYLYRGMFDIHPNSIIYDEPTSFSKKRSVAKEFSCSSGTSGIILKLNTKNKTIQYFDLHLFLKYLLKHIQLSADLKEMIYLHIHENECIVIIKKEEIIISKFKK